MKTGGKINNRSVVLQSLYGFVINYLCYVIYLFEEKRKRERNKEKKQKH